MRSLLGSATPFLFGFLRLPSSFVRTVKFCAIAGPAFTVGFGVLLALAGLDHMYAIEQGAMRLGASGEPPFLAGFALIGVYAALLECLDARGGAYLGFAALNLAIILCTGARGPLLLGLALTVSVLARQRRLMLLAALGALLSLAVMFGPALTTFRVIDLMQLGEAESLSHRDAGLALFPAGFRRLALARLGSRCRQSHPPSFLTARRAYRHQCRA